MHADMKHTNECTHCVIQHYMKEIDEGEKCTKKAGEITEQNKNKSNTFSKKNQLPVCRMGKNLWPIFAFHSHLSEKVDCNFCI